MRRAQTSMIAMLFFTLGVGVGVSKHPEEREPVVLEYRPAEKPVQRYVLPPATPALAWVARKCDLSPSTLETMRRLAVGK